MHIYLPLAVCIIGLIVFALSENPKVQALAKDAFWTGLLVSLYIFSGKTVP